MQRARLYAMPSSSAVEDDAQGHDFEVIRHVPTATIGVFGPYVQLPSHTVVSASAPEAIICQPNPGRITALCPAPERYEHARNACTRSSIRANLCGRSDWAALRLYVGARS
jgi:hypothetical protein